jgi:cellulose biosynthesis protein BcsQ
MAHEFANRGTRVLVIDMDKQRDATDTLLPETLRKSDKLNTTSDIVLLGVEAKAIAVCPDEHSEHPRFGSNLWVIPAHRHQHAAELDLQSQWTEEAVLSSIGKGGKVNARRRAERRAALELAHYAKFRKLIDSVNGQFDLVLFDTPGNPGLLTNLALSASDWALAVMRPSGFDVKGLGELKHTLSLVRGSVNPRLRLAGCILNEAEGRTKVAKRWNEQIARAFGSAAQFRASVPHSVRFEECAHEHRTVFEKDEPGTERLRESFRTIVSEMVQKGEDQIKAEAAESLKRWNEEQLKAANE